LTEKDDATQEDAAACDNGNDQKPKNTRRLLSRYLPEGFDWGKCPKPIRDAAQEFVSTLYLERLENRRTKEDWNPISATIFREKCGRNKADKARHWTVSNGIVECDRKWSKGEKCLGYRLSQAFKDVTFRLAPITDRTFLKRVGNVPNPCTTRLHRHIQKQLRRIDAAMPEDLPEEQRQVLQMVNDRGVRVQNPEDESGGRFHSTVTNMRKELRKYLRVDGETLMEADTKNCQPLMLVPVLEATGMPCPEYRKLCEDGTLYDFLAGKTGLEREQVKEEFIASVLFGKSRSPSETKTAFREAFPQVSRAIREIKRKDHAELSRRLQRAESDVVIRTACERLRKERPAMFFTPIHDSIVAKSCDIETVACVMRDSFASFGLRPKITVKPL